MIYYLFLANRMQVDLTGLAKQKTEYKFIGFRKIQQLAENIIFFGNSINFGNNPFFGNLGPDRSSRPCVSGGEQKSCNSLTHQQSSKQIKSLSAP